MKKQFTFDKKYFAAAVLLFLIEVFIAVYVKDDFIRPYVGDFLVVIFMYCFVKSFWKAPPFRVAAYVLLFSFAIEFLQYFNFVEHLGLNHSKVARIILGTSFAWEDLLAYFLGFLAILGFEK